MDVSYNNVIALSAEFGNAAPHHLYALIDHGGHPGLTGHLNKFKVAWSSLFQGSRDEGALEVAPILVPIRTAHSLAVSRSCMTPIFERARYSSSMTFLHSPLDLQALNRRLAVRLDVSLPDGVEMLLRFFDGRVFESLMNTLSPSQKVAFLSPARAWWWVDRAGQVQLQTSEFLETDSPEIPLGLTSTQEAALIDASEIDQVAMLLEAVMPANFEALVGSDRVSFLRKNIAAAHSYRIVSPNDVTLFCTLALTHGDGFEHRTPWVQHFEKVNSGQTSFYDVLQSIAVE
ncbi:DUF4123 domain-containing protein [Massilia sp. PAMC28688]|uniref:DUF4123 domain-containing protein n=1 Tax=Massilia sp. PAMC28688 TaxID=2861283 RepID=UPI001C62CC0A|nr:DUF4123 domain-containing protein [Massilia sp. PAMC28688]QYF91596.1 DUF4123 domain-containing protein [Massilia sp. PAMC28688]